MDHIKAAFIEFMVRCRALRFGSFTAKSGRQTPYFVDLGQACSGRRITRLGEFYAQAIVDAGLDPTLLFGPAYKGIPLVVTAAAALSSGHGVDVDFCFNRKEGKDHGEGGRFVGRAPRAGDRVLIVEDVTTAGTSIRETVPLLQAAAQVQLAGLVVSVDRQERGKYARSALRELSETYRMPCHAIVTVDEIIDYLRGRPIDGEIVLTDPLVEAMLDYRARYGAR